MVDDKQNKKVSSSNKNQNDRNKARKNDPKKQNADQKGVNENKDKEHNNSNNDKKKVRQILSNKNRAQHNNVSSNGKTDGQNGSDKSVKGGLHKNNNNKNSKDQKGVGKNLKPIGNMSAKNDGNPSKATNASKDKNSKKNIAKADQEKSIKNSSTDNKNNNNNINNNSGTSIVEQQAKKKSKNKRRKRTSKKVIEGFKLVIRLLPPNLNESDFLNTIIPVVGNDFKNKFNIQYSYYFNGSIPSSPFEEPVHSRAYFVFSNIDDLKIVGSMISKLNFIDNENNLTNTHLFVSPYVKDPLIEETEETSTLAEEKSNSNSKNNRGEGTIQNDPLFKAFLKTLVEIDKNPQIAYNDGFSYFKSIDKEILREKAYEKKVLEKSEKALVELAGVDISSTNDDKAKSAKKKRKKKKKKKKSKEQKEIAKDVAKGTTKSKSKNNATNNNVVILEEAGKKELQKRKRGLKHNDKNSSLMNADSLASISLASMTQYSKTPWGS